MKFIDLHQQYQSLKEGIDEAIQNVLDHGQYIMGPEVHELQERLADYVKSRHCIVVSSGTIALQVALMALEIKPGDEVITSAFSFFAPWEAIVLLGATPILIDIDPQTYNLDPQYLEAAITPRTKAIMPVSLFGQCADFTQINAIAAKYRLPVIEDGAQSFGATHVGNYSCALTTIGCTSFFPSKPLGCYGDGGACFTNDDQLAARMRSIINHGQESRYHHTHLGTNARFDSIQAAVLLKKLEVFDREIKLRHWIANYYNQAFAGNVMTPKILPQNTSTFAQYTIQVDNRDVLQQVLAEQKIPTMVHYPCGVHEQPIVKQYFNQKYSLPNTERISRRVLSLPFHPYQNTEQIDQVVQAVLEQVLQLVS